MPKKEINIVGFDSSDVHEDIETWVPKDPNNVYLCIDIFIGVKGEEGSDSFQLVIATPEGISSTLENDEVLALEHTVLIKKYDWDIVAKYISKTVKKCTSNTWDESAKKLSKYFLWEYHEHTYIKLDF